MANPTEYNVLGEILNGQIRWQFTPSACTWLPGVAYTTNVCWRKLCDRLITTGTSREYLVPGTLGPTTLHTWY